MTKNVTRYDYDEKGNKIGTTTTKELDWYEYCMKGHKEIRRMIEELKENNK